MVSCGVVVVWYGVLWYDVVWYGVVWYDVVWYDVYGMLVCYGMCDGMVWYGTVRKYIMSRTST